MYIFYVSSGPGPSDSLKFTSLFKYYLEGIGIFTIFTGRILKIRQYEEVFTDIACPAVRSHAGLMGPRADNIHRTGTVHHNTGQPNGLQVQLPIDQRNGRTHCTIVAVVLLGAYNAAGGGRCLESVHLYSHYTVTANSQCPTSATARTRLLCPLSFQ